MLRTILQYSALLLSHTHPTSLFFYHGSRSSRSRFSHHHLLRGSIAWAFIWAVWIKTLMPTLLIASLCIFGFDYWTTCIVLLRQCCFQSHSSCQFIAQFSLKQACFVRYRRLWRCGSLFAYHIEDLRLSLVHLLGCTQSRAIEQKIRIACWSLTYLPGCFLNCGDIIHICSIL